MDREGKSTPLRICLISYMLSEDATGLRSFLSGLVTHLLNEGVEVTVLGTDCGYQGRNGGAALKLDPRARLIVFPVRGAIKRRFYWCSSLARWLRLHRAEFDVVDIQGIWAAVNVQVAFMAHRLAIPYVLTPHGMLTRWDWSKRNLAKRVAYRLGVERMIKRASCVRFLSRGEFDESANPVGSRTVVIPNAVDVSTAPSNLSRDEFKARFQLGDGTAVIFFLGRISQQKGVIPLIEAVQMLHRRNPDVVLLLAGPESEPEYATQVKRKIQRSHYPEKFHLLGPVYGEDKNGYLHYATIFATLSENEGLSLAALEALACGLPVVLTKNAHMPDVQEAGAGGVVDVAPPAVAAQFELMIQDRTQLLKMKKSARRLHESSYSWEAVMPALVKLYSSVSIQ